MNEPNERAYMVKKYIDVKAFSEKIGRTTLIDIFSLPPSTVQILNILANFPAADVQEIRYGKWIKQPTDFSLCGTAYYGCSICEKEAQIRTNYCPWCGAKMDGDRE